MNELLTSKPVCRVDLLMNKLKEFYKNEEHIDTLINIVSGNSEIALRDIDWLCTNYSKKYNVIYNIKEEKNDEIINKRFILYINYRSQLKAYTKEFFDPFCRRDRIEFFYNDNESIITTVGQLNFFRWALENEIISYIKDNLDKIETDMNFNIRKTNKQEDNKNKSKKISKNLSECLSTKKPERKKRKELSTSATNTINKHQINITLDFE